MNRILLFGIVVSILFLAPESQGYSTPNLPLDDHAYRDIDKLIAAGLIEDALYGYRPWSEAEIARMVQEAEKRWDKTAPPSFVEAIIKRLKKRFDLENPRPLTIDPIQSATVGFTSLDNPPTPIPLNNGLGSVDATVAPLTNFSEGRHFAEGQTAALETVHTARLSPYFSVLANPRFEALLPHSTGNEANVIVHRLYGKAGYRKFFLQVGRENIAWGQGEHGGLLLSNNARPLDMIRAGTESPLYLPSLLQYAGPTSFQLFVANLGPEQDIPRPFLTGYKLAFKPVRFFEIAVNHLVLMGGEGSNAPGFFDAISEFTGVFPAFLGNKGGEADTNRLFSIEIRWLLPFLRNASFYAEGAFDDTISDSEVLFEDEAMYLTGFYLPYWTDSGTVDLRIEYKHLPAIAYRHSLYTSGHSLNRRLLGDPLGPDSDGAYGKIRWDLREGLLLTSGLAYERRDSDRFLTITAGGENIDIVGIENNPAEHRWRLEEGLEWKWREGLASKLMIGYEHAWNALFQQNHDQDHWMAQLELTITKFPF
ncbi:MAG: hypothetical protein HYW02_08225 [Deltaproteobacteria bacterium]|nr:hypothetical protein [Deltaproteobacteria bacterium]